MCIYFFYDCSSIIYSYYCLIISHCNIRKAYDKLRQDHRVIKKLIINPDYKRPILGFARQLFSLRLQFTLESLRNGTHVLVTDLDNIFNRYVPLRGILEEGYDVYHSYEMKYPQHIFDRHGFVVCAGHQFIRASAASIQYLNKVLGDCFEESNCDDQIQYNNVLLETMNMTWDRKPSRKDSKRISSEIDENDGLLVEGLSGQSESGLKVKVWDRDFAWRLSADIPDKCPSKNNWLSMPAKVDYLEQTERLNMVGRKIEMFHIWNQICRDVT